MVVLDHPRPVAAATGLGPPQQPLTTMIAFGEALVRRDPLAAAAHLSPGARLLRSDGTEVSGVAALGLVLDRLTSETHRLEIRPGRTIVSGEVALCTQSWRLVPADLRQSFARANRATFVLGRADGNWQILIAAPWG
jgi:ketosteroid isomerase-like protein